MAHRRVPGLMMMIACLSFLSAETPKINFEFIDQPYSDILYAMSRFSGFSIIADDTVTGKTSFQFAGNSFAQAFDSFLLVHRLYVTRNDKTWTVSRFLISKDERGTSVDATDIGAARLIEALSAITGETIVGETLPTDNLSIHVSAASPEEIARAIVKPFPGYTVDRESGSLLVRKKINAQQQTAPLARMSLTRSEGLWNLEINQANFSELVERISREERLGYSNFVRNAPPLAGILASSETLDGIVAVVVEQAGAECVIKNGIRYYLPGQASDAAKRIRESDCDWETFTSSSIRMDRALPLLQARFPGVQFLAATQTDTCVAKIGIEQKKNVDEFLALVDRSEPIETIRLRYISTQDFLKTLPPAIRREDISDTGTGHSFFYVGPQSAKELLLKELKEIDVPKPRIRYDMLIIQYDKSSNLVWGSSAEIRPMEPGDVTAITGSFGSLLNLNFDAITIFGYTFSARLNAALSENRAQVFADTTLHGISGENVKFQNTSTYRYRDSNVDATTGKPVYTGITREIVSGVTLEINGWVSGEGMVTMGINASVSKRGADVTTANGNPPATSEKIIATKLSTADGEPVILSGLEQNDTSIVEQRTPIISRIPLIGWLFMNYGETKQKSEMVIYLVPHITNGKDRSEERDTLERTAIERLVAPIEARRKK